MALFAAVQVVLIQMLPDEDDPDRENGRWKATRWFIYAGIFFDLGGAISAVALVQMAAALPITARNIVMHQPESLPARVFYQKEDIPDDLLYGFAEDDLLRRFGMGRKWNAMVWHMMLSFAIGCVSIFISIGLWIFSTEQWGIAGGLLPLIVVAVYPVVIVLGGH